jgi:hypothetical protein
MYSRSHWIIGVCDDGLIVGSSINDNLWQHYCFPLRPNARVLALHGFSVALAKLFRWYVRRCGDYSTLSVFQVAAR